ncbi:hypothetical protein J5J10_11560 [Ciceribacter sp. L1K23]|uniref:hypothetical protein n=1 Tax=Ciceribacter sp. L1K23 TaxID=2820276 RepID=UPI001B825139|nr:hypothetical protein [Ciceribacter sp. L1K23]MBR0556314.1 hypothetical protein [Ciceribacter sp. L1K23]
MTIARRLIRIVALLAIIIGIVWVGQGTGLFPYPASSFMINQAPWVLYGILLAAAGIVLMFVSRRFQR